MSALEIAVVLGVSTALATLVLVLTQRFTSKTVGFSVPSGSPVAFLFEDDTVVHATPLGQSLLDHAITDIQWKDLHSTFAMRFPSLPVQLPTAATNPIEVHASDPDDQSLLRIEAVGRHTRLELIEADIDALQKERHAARNISILHSKLDEMCQTAPFLMWRESVEGKVVWSNAAYETLARSADSDALARDEPVLKMPYNVEERCKARVPVERKTDGKAAWFEVSATKTENGTLHHATSIDAVIQAEIAQRNFVQTLAKTFAQLSTGLAIFDRNRQLVLFNPALVDLTGLQIEFLSARPELTTFFDNLRDRRAMPEPKNYASWRNDITSMIDAATDGDFQETWSLHGGRTYRVTGRPHPDGALAFLIEDISEEISKTRDFRAEVDLGHRVLDSFEDAIAIFSQNGVLIYCNRFYRDLWRQNPDMSFANLTIADCVNVWKSACAPHVPIDETERFVRSVGVRTAWSSMLKQSDGQSRKMVVSPISSGETMIRFLIEETKTEVA